MKRYDSDFVLLRGWRDGFTAGRPPVEGRTVVQGYTIIINVTTAISEGTVLLYDEEYRDLLAKSARLQL